MREWGGEGTQETSVEDKVNFVLKVRAGILGGDRTTLYLDLGGIYMTVFFKVHRIIYHTG